MEKRRRNAPLWLQYNTRRIQAKCQHYLCFLTSFRIFNSRWGIWVSLETPRPAEPELLLVAQCSPSFALQGWQCIFTFGPKFNESSFYVVRYRPMLTFRFLGNFLLEFRRHPQNENLGLRHHFPRVENGHFAVNAFRCHEPLFS
jgi:hypothetical protein